MKLKRLLLVAERGNALHDDQPADSPLFLGGYDTIEHNGVPETGTADVRDQEEPVSGTPLCLTGRLTPAERAVMERTVLELTRGEILERVEVGARRRRGLSASEMLQRYRAGTLDEPCDVADLLALADLLPENDPVFAV